MLTAPQSAILFRQISFRQPQQSTKSTGTGKNASHVRDIAGQFKVNRIISPEITWILSRIRHCVAKRTLETQSCPCVYLSKFAVCKSVWCFCSSAFLCLCTWCVYMLAGGILLLLWSFVWNKICQKFAANKSYSLDFLVIVFILVPPVSAMKSDIYSFSSTSP